MPILCLRNKINGTRRIYRIIIPSAVAVKRVRQYANRFIRAFHQEPTNDGGFSLDWLAYSLRDSDADSVGVNGALAASVAAVGIDEEQGRADALRSKGSDGRGRGLRRRENKVHASMD